MGTLAAESTTSAAGEAQLYERHSDSVYRYCLRMLGSREDAEDATQTTFFQALRAMRRGVVPTFEQAWLLKIAQNECKSRHRAGSRRRQRELTHDPQSLAELAEAPNGGDGRLVGVQEALARLPETQRRALLLREWQGRSYAEIAHELGTTRPAVEALLFRARRGLAHELGEEKTTRRHAFDLASLLGALKSLLSGGAAVKVAAGIAALATVGTVAAGSRQGAAPMIPARDVTSVERSGPTLDRSQGVFAGQPASSPVRHGKDAVGATRRGSVSTQRPKADSPARDPQTPAGPAIPGVEQPAPQAGPGQSPATPPVKAPSAPSVPSVPSVPEVPQLPSTPQPPALQAPQLPAVPSVPELPKVEVPKVEVPKVEVPKVEVPQLPAVPDVPELPAVEVPDVPILP